MCENENNAEYVSDKNSSLIVKEGREQREMTRQRCRSSRLGWSRRIKSDLSCSDWIRSGTGFSLTVRNRIIPIRWTRIGLRFLRRWRTGRFLLPIPVRTGDGRRGRNWSRSNRVALLRFVWRTRRATNLNFDIAHFDHDRREQQRWWRILINDGKCFFVPDRTTYSGALFQTDGNPIIAWSNNNGLILRIDNRWHIATWRGKTIDELLKSLSSFSLSAWCYL